jgi:hypothetical protein
MEPPGNPARFTPAIGFSLGMAKHYGRCGESVKVYPGVDAAPSKGTTRLTAVTRPAQDGREQPTARPDKGRRTAC